ncbi:MAG TPA: hypothetical protein DHV63_08910 [Pseudomonas sp.]|nr:hypothetical protein [Pseudomonas sp.]
MNRFTNPLQAELQPDRKTWRLLAPFSYLDPDHGLIEVPTGFTTDFASIRIVRTLAVIGLGLSLLLSLSPWAWLSYAAYVVGLACLALYAAVAGYGHGPAAIHDWIYKTGMLPRGNGDHVIFNALRSEGVARWRAWIFWTGVRIGGSRRYIG